MRFFWLVLGMFIILVCENGLVYLIIFKVYSFIILCVIVSWGNYKGYKILIVLFVLYMVKREGIGLYFIEKEWRF